MRRRWLPLSAVVLVAACSSPDDVALLSSEQLDETTTNPSPPPTPPPTATDGETIPDFTLPQPPSTTSATPPSSPSTSTPGTDETELPDDCVPLPDDAPSLLVTTPEGVVLQVGPDGTQQIADSEDLDAPITSAWRAEGGTLWVALGLGDSVGRLDADEYLESGNGNVSLQHVGTLDGEPVALWFDIAGEFDPGATEGGRVVIEHADGSQDDLGPAWTTTGSVQVGNIGADTVLLTRVVDGRQQFDYVDGAGRPAHDDWYDPTERQAAPGLTRSSAAVSDDGRTLIWTEQTRTAVDEAGDLELVVGRTSGSEIQERVTLAGPDEGQTTGDFDGRWAVASFTDGLGPTRTVLVDTTADTPEPVVPCIPLGSATIDRAGGGGESPPTTSPPTTAATPSTPSPSTTDAPSTPPGTTPSTDVGGDPIDP